MGKARDCRYLGRVADRDEIERRRRDWAEQAEVDFADIVPRAFPAWWASIPFATMVAAGLHYLAPFELSASASAATAATLFGWGSLLRRGPKPTVVRFWSAVILAIAAFLAMLVFYLDRDSPLLTAWASCSAAGLTYLVVMTLRPAAFTRPSGAS